eukprot:scaffold132472_cov35-Attheya_sp.AAC.1
MDIINIALPLCHSFRFVLHVSSADSEWLKWDPASRGPLYLTPSHTTRMTAHMESICMAPSDTNGQQTVRSLMDIT